MGSKPEPTMRNAAGLLLLLLQHLLLCLSLPTPQDAEGHDNQNKDTDFCIRTDKGFLEHAKRQFTQSMEKFTQSIYLHAAEKNPNSNFVFSPLSTGELSVSKISHTALLEVSKEGTEGVAATGAEIVLLSSAFNDRLDVVVDRPFIFVVEDKQNKIPVLVGRVMDPTVKIP